MYESNKKRLIGLCVRIAVLKGVTKSSTNPDYPKHSLAVNILHTSTLQQLYAVSPTDESGEDSNHNIITLTDTSTNQTNEQLMWNVISNELSDDENELLESILCSETKKKEYDINEKKLLSRIKQIIINNGIRIKPCLSKNRK